MLNDATGFDELNELERWKLSESMPFASSGQLGPESDQERTVRAKPERSHG